MIYVLLFINIIMLVFGQVLWKFGVRKSEFSFSIKGFINLISNPYILGGGIIYLFATIIWVYILSQEELSRVYPLQSLCYVFGTLAGVLIFKECITVSKGMGLVFIIIGAFIIASK